MAEWFLEEGIGETRTLLIEGDEVLEARLQWHGEMISGEVHEAQLIKKQRSAKRGTVRLGNGIQAWTQNLPAQATEGVSGKVRVTRAPIAEKGRLKLAQTRWLNKVGHTLDPVPLAGEPVQAFDAGLWEEVWHAASSGSIAFTGGEILVSATPAMTVIDVDGELEPKELCLAAIPAIAKALYWFDIGGNIGIDFPSLDARHDRRIVDEALAEFLDDWPHERTAMNGFGFVQIIARLEGPSLIHRFATSRVGMCARYALRVGERAQGAGPVLLLRVHPALKAKLKPEWLEELARRSGKQVRMETDASLALEGPSAQILEA